MKEKRKDKKSKRNNKKSKQDRKEQGGGRGRGGGGAEVIVKGSELNDFVVHQFHLFITHLVTDFIIIM